MSKNLNKSATGNTPKNTLFNYFTKSPAFAEKKKIPKTPSEDKNSSPGEKENVANEANPQNSSATTTKRLVGRNLDKELKDSVKSGTAKQKVAVDEDEDNATPAQKRRRRILIEDSDSSEDEGADEKEEKKYDFDTDNDGDDDYKASSESGSDAESNESSGDEENEDSPVVKKVQPRKKRKATDEQPTKKPKMEIESENEDVNVKNLSILEKIQALQESGNSSANGKDLNIDDMFAADEKNNNDDEPISWPHQKLEFLKPDKIKDKNGNRPDHPDYDPSTLHVPTNFLNGLSPGVRQWWVLKSDNYDCVLFFKVGKFYELYHMDADVGVRELGFTYMRGEFAHSGFPEVSFDKMSSILVDRGYKIARVEQTETPDMMTERCKKIKATKFDKVVRREICQILNRGTMVFSAQCEVNSNYQANYMLAIAEKNEGTTSRYGIAYIDTSIGDFYIGEFADDKNCSRLLTMISHHMPVLVLSEKSSLSERTEKILRTMLINAIKEKLPSNESQRCTAEKTLKHLAENYYSTTTNEDNWPAVLHIMQDPDDKLGLTPHPDYALALKATGICITYMRKCCVEEKVLPMVRFHLYTPPDVAFVKTEENESEIDTDTASTSKSNVHINANKFMVLDAMTLANLRIVGEEQSLLALIDHCCTKFGKRLLHHWVCAPSCNCSVILERQKAISELVEHGVLLQDLRALLAPLPDIERQLAQIHLFGSKLVSENTADGRAILFEEKQYNKRKMKTFIALLNSLNTIQAAIPKMFENCESSLLRRLTQHPKGKATTGGMYPDMSEPLHFFKTAFNHTNAADTGVIAPERGIDADFDAAEEKIDEVKRQLQIYLKEQEAYFGCRVNYFGSDKKRFQLEVPEHKTKKATDDYQLEGQRKGSNAVKRYTTDVTRDLLRKMQKAEEERNCVVKDLARRVFEKFSNHYVTWKQCIDCVGHLDVIASLAEYARLQTVICVPVVHPINEKPFIDIESGYHPCLPSETYIPNSIQLGTKDMAPLTLLTGPNMGGKSTFMRQVGLLLVMAQIGSHVPAERCEFTLVDRIFTRLGAQDDIVAGQSTFMVEMTEASLMLKHATLHSFVLMDELGRGTATYDGTAIAAAVVNFLANLGCCTMFSTHYKSLTDNFGKDSRIQLGHMACMVENDECDDPTEETVTFLYKYVGGACSKSYGFNAAKLAGMPLDIVKRAYELSKEVEAIALERKIIAKIYDVATGTEAPEADANKQTLTDIMDLLKQLKACRL